jgi:pre-60S factor REI1
LGQTFDATRCLFCHAKNSDFGSNISHMLKTHGFLVPEQDRLQVDLETLIAYLDLFISGYSQCLYCGTQRSSDEAARQHMMANGHCKFDITSQGSEFRDFYEFESDDAVEDEAQSSSSAVKAAAPPFVQVDETSIRLPSGKILSNRSVRPRYHRDRRLPDAIIAVFELIDNLPNSAEASEAPSSGQSLGPVGPVERRNLALEPPIGGVSYTCHPCSNGHSLQCRKGRWMRPGELSR